MRHLNLVDKFLCELDTALRTLAVPTNRKSLRPYPGDAEKEPKLSEAEKKHVSGLMRVNHSGEVAAQALYQGQALTAKLTNIKEQMTDAANEEVEHLAWCEERLRELDSKPSILNPLWYGGSLLIGALAGIAGDKWSLGFVVETERQVTSHLKEHLQKLPKNDLKTKAIITKMHEDEEHHANIANIAGANKLPFFVSQLMSCVSKFLTKSSYYI